MRDPQGYVAWYGSLQAGPRDARGDVAGHDLLQADLLKNGVGAVA
ncbi:MAG TPA: hypothetical protein VFA88_06940 [Gaiellaceae bacterium]|nr:hypothetical protein [Gaiellaceae bacterium]